MSDLSIAGQLDGKLALVTGGGSGIGEATARLFAQEGAIVVVAGRRREEIESVAADIGGHAIVCDVSDQGQVQNLFQKACKITERVDILLNNAGRPGPIATVAGVNIQAWVECMDINLVGAMYCLQEAAKVMIKQQSGSIINMSSLMGIQGYPMRLANVASKFALI